MLQAITIQDIFDWNRYYKNRRQLYDDFYDASEESKMYASFHYLLKYYFFRENCIVALQKLQTASVTENFLQTGIISEWVRTYEWLGSKRLVTFLADNKPDEQNNSLEILSLKMHVELEPFMPLVVFCEVFKILHGELQLHLPANERKFDRPGYHYYPVAEPTSADIRVKKWLKKLK